MNNWLRFVDKDNQILNNLSQKEIQKIAAEKFSYISSLIKYSKCDRLKMKEFGSPEWNEGAFACGLWEEWKPYFQEFMDWKINFEEIPIEYFEPKYLYYRLPLLLAKENDVLWPIVDYELQRAESSDFWDVIWNSREAILHNLPVTSVGMFFNTFDDIFVWKLLIKRWRAKKLWVLNLYRDVLQTSWQLNIKESKSRLEQFSTLALYHRLKGEFPDDFDTEILVNNDVQEEFYKFLPYFDEILDIQISNSERILKKNEILRPIIDRLWGKDMEDEKRAKMKEQIEKEKEEQQKQDLEDNKQNTRDDLMNDLWDNQNEGDNWEWNNSSENSWEWNNSSENSWEWNNSSENSWEWSNSWENSWQWDKSWENSWQWDKSWENSWQWNNSLENSWEWNNSWENSWQWNNSLENSWEWNNSLENSWQWDNSWESSWEWNDSSENSWEWNDSSENSWEWNDSSENSWEWNDSSKSSWEWNDLEDDYSWNDVEKSSSRIEDEIKRRLAAMSQKEMEDFMEKIKKEIDEKNMQEHGDALQLQKELLTEKDANKIGNIQESISDAIEKWQEMLVQELGKENEETIEEPQDQWKHVINAVEQREDDLEQEEIIQKALAQISRMKTGNDFEKISEAQDKLATLEACLENISNEDIKDRVNQSIKAMSDYIDQQEKDYETLLDKTWFSREEADLYWEYLKIEQEMSKYLDKFISELEKEIPKLKECKLEWWYSSWRVTDVNDAGKKIKLKQFGEKLYSRTEEDETMKVNLWICLSIDNSWSMERNMEDTTKLVVFLWLLCQRRWIPFHVNTFCGELNVIKNVGDKFESQKGKLMRELDASGWCTDLSLSVEKDLEVIKSIKTKYPDTVFLPIFITDWCANSWVTGSDLIDLMKWFKWLSIMAWIWVNEYYLRQWYPDSKVIWMNDSSEIMTKLLKSLKQFFVQNKSKIFKVITQ